MKKAGIKRKIRFIVLGISIVSLSTFCAVAFWGLFSIRMHTRQSSAMLGEFATKNSSAFLEREAVDKLLTKARGRARIISGELQIIAKDAAYFAGHAAEIYKNAFRLSPVPIPYSASKDSGTLTMQLKSAGGPADYPRIRREVELLGNITPAFVSNAGDMKEVTVSLYLGTESGFSIVYNPFANSESAAFDPRVRPWYIGAKERGGAFWTAPYIDASSGKLIVTCAYPFFDGNNTFRGVAGIDVVIADLNREIVNADVVDQSYAFVVDDEGTLISAKGFQPGSAEGYRKQSAYREGNPAYNSVIDRMRNGETGVERVRTDDGDMFMAYALIDATDWSVVIMRPVSEVMELVQENSAAIERMTGETLKRVNATIMFMLIGFVLLFAAVVVAIIYLAGSESDKITRPIVMLEGCLERIAGGELDTRIDIKTGDEIERLGGSVNRMAAALKEHIRDLQRITSEKERIGAELDVATKIQARMLPCVFPPFPHRSEFDIYASMQPAREVGGDFYDFFFVGIDTLAVVMADVSGKGVPAALFMVIAKTLIKNNAQSGKSPKDVFETVNNMLCEGNETGMFVTAFMGYLNVKIGTFTYVNAGHTPPALRTDGRYDLLTVKPGFVLAGMEGTRFTQGEITLQKGDELFLYTDGVTEAVDEKNALFGGKRMVEALNSSSGLPVNEVAVSIKREIKKFAGNAEQADDITVLALRYNGAGDAKKNPDGAGKISADEFSAEAKPENLEAALDFVDGKLNSAGCPKKQRNLIAVSVEEIFVNIAHYAYGSATGSVAIRVSAGDEAEIVFEDCGAPYNPLEKGDPDISASLEEREPGGLGIFMVKKLMDAVDYRREGNKNILTIRKKLNVK